MIVAVLPVPGADEAAALLLPAHRRPARSSAVSRATPCSAESWLLGYLWLRLGRHDLAHRWWERVLDPRLRARTCASRAASLRELGLHERAERADRAGLASVGAATPGPDRAALRIGLVADAVGRGDVDAAQHRLRSATAVTAALPDTVEAARQRIRLDWVGVEVDLVGGRPPRAPLPGMAADGSVVTPPHYAAGSQHHLAKGLLFAGVVRREPAALDAAAVRASPGLVWAVHLARADLGVAEALGRARASWRAIVAPDELRGAVAATPVGRRLGSPAAGTGVATAGG